MLLKNLENDKNTCKPIKVENNYTEPAFIARTESHKTLTDTGFIENKNVLMSTAFVSSSEFHT